MPFSSHPDCQLWGCFPVNIDCTRLKICMQASFWKLNSNPAKNYNIALQCDVFMPCCSHDSWLRLPTIFSREYWLIFVSFLSALANDKLYRLAMQCLQAFFNLFTLFYNRLYYTSIWKFGIVNISFKISKKSFSLHRDGICA